jgi:hypothetical protein
MELNIRTSINIVESVKKLNLEKNEQFYAIKILSDIAYASLFYEEKSIKKSSNYFQKICGNYGNSYTKIINILIANNLLKQNNSYQVGNYSKSYTTNIKISEKWVTVKVDKYLTKRQIQNYKNRQKKDIDKTAQWHSRNLKNIVTFDWDKLSILIGDKFKIDVLPYKETILKALTDLSVDDVLKEHYSYLDEEELNSLKRKLIIMQQKIYELITLENNVTIVGSKGGRHYTPLSNASKEIRKCLVSKIKNKPYLIEIDIKNSQPTFLLGMCNKKGLIVEEEVKNEILNGKFYELVGGLWLYDKEEITHDKAVRDIVKKITYSNILFPKNIIRNNSKYFHEISKNFPKFASAIQILAEEYSLASVLQSAEANLMLPITKSLKAVGIHDSIILSAETTEEEIEKTKQMIKKEFIKEFKISPQLSYEIISVMKA